MLTIITPTGERPQAFELCQRMLMRQSYTGPVRWLVVDDGEVPQKVTLKRRGWSVDVIRPEPFWKTGDNTQGRNILAALDRVGADDLVVFWEDDDWYSPDWLSEVRRQSERAELVGECDAVYYNVFLRKWSQIRNYEHASLRCSALRGRAIETMREVIEEDQRLPRPYRYYDMKLWKRHDDKAVFEGNLTVGIKGLPGRAGIALGHDDIRGKFDPEGKDLRALIGGDAEWYLPFYKELKMTKTKYFVTRDFRLYGQDWKVGEEFVPKARIDAELHMHAKKVERRTVTVKKAPAARAFKVQDQEQKLQSEVIEKAADTEEAQPVDDVSPADGAFASEEEKPKRFGRRRKAKQAAPEDE